MHKIYVLILFIISYMDNKMKFCNDK